MPASPNQNTADNRSNKGKVAAIVIISCLLVATTIVALFIYPGLLMDKPSDGHVSDAGNNNNNGNATQTTPAPSTPEVNPVSLLLLEMRDELNELFVSNGFWDAAFAFIDYQGLVINLQTSILYSQNTFDISQSGADILRLIGPYIATSGLPVFIEGHTDNVPVSPAYADNDALSLQWATGVSEFFVNENLLESSGVTAYGSGMEHSIVGNSTPEERQINNRVEISLIHNFGYLFLDEHAQNEHKPSP